MSHRDPISNQSFVQWFIRSITSWFIRVVNTMTYVHIRTMLRTPEQGHRLRRWPNIHLQQQPDGNEYGKELSIFAMIMAEGTSERTKEPPFEQNVREILNSDNQTDWNGILSEWKHTTGKRNYQQALLTTKMKQLSHANSFWNHEHRNQWCKGTPHGCGRHPLHGLFRTVYSSECRTMNWMECTMEVYGSFWMELATTVYGLNVYSSET